MRGSLLSLLPEQILTFSAPVASGIAAPGCVQQCGRAGFGHFRGGICVPGFLTLEMLPAKTCPPVKGPLYPSQELCWFCKGPAEGGARPSHIPCWRGARQWWGSPPCTVGTATPVALSPSPCRVPSPGSGATCLTHCDGSDTEAEVSLIMSSVKSLSSSTGCGRSALLPSCSAALKGCCSWCGGQLGGD